MGTRKKMSPKRRSPRKKMSPKRRSPRKKMSPKRRSPRKKTSPKRRSPRKKRMSGRKRMSSGRGGTAPVPPDSGGPPIVGPAAARGCDPAAEFRLLKSVVDILIENGNTFVNKAKIRPDGSGKINDYDHWYINCGGNQNIWTQLDELGRSGGRLTWGDFMSEDVTKRYFRNKVLHYHLYINERGCAVGNLKTNQFIYEQIRISHGRNDDGCRPTISEGDENQVRNIRSEEPLSSMGRNHRKIADYITRTLNIQCRSREPDGETKNYIVNDGNLEQRKNREEVMRKCQWNATDSTWEKAPAYIPPHLRGRPGDDRGDYGRSGRYDDRGGRFGRSNYGNWRPN